MNADCTGRPHFRPEYLLTGLSEHFRHFLPLRLSVSVGFGLGWYVFLLVVDLPGWVDVHTPLQKHTSVDE